MLRNDGKQFEILAKQFFVELFEELGFIINKERIQFNGTQDGFDLQIIIGQDYIERNLFIECKDYSSDLKFGNIYAKAHDLEANYQFTEKDIALFISPRANFSNGRNAEKSEPIFNNGKFRFHSRFLDKTNRIEKLFATNKEVYEKIYKKELLLQVDKNEEYERFKSIILSRGPIKKIKINQVDRQNYILNIENNKSYISRTISTPEDSKNRKEKSRYIITKKKSFNLITATKSLFNSSESNGFVILGNPGTGKSVELREAALFFWKNRNIDGLVPFYRPINSFIYSSAITDYLPKEWKNIPHLLIILDGLDEISHSLEFKTKLDKFLLENPDANVKFVLSCRTNIYENVIKGLGDFICYELDEILPSQAIEYLNKKYNLPFEGLNSLSFNNDQKDFLENPYYLDLFGEYYQETKTLPTNKTTLTEKYINKRLEDDRVRKYKNLDYDKSKITISCKKVALSLEALSESKIQDTKIALLIGDDKKLFINSCFIEKTFNEDSWKFEHKNIQEYFVASTLENLDFEDIIKFIQIEEGVKKSHPSWLNSISHLLNLMDYHSDKFNQLIEWLIANDSEVLFKADRDRLSEEHKALVFQNYFNKRCKEQTLWIGKYDSEFKGLSRFAETNSNIQYLIKELKDSSNHIRTRISSIELLAEMDLTHLEAEIRELIISLVKAPLNEIDPSFKSTVIDSVQRINFLRDDSNFINDIIIVLGDLDHLEVTNSILNLILNVNCNHFFKYIKNITPKVFDNSLRKYQREGNLSTGEKHVLVNIFKKLTSFEACVFEIDTRLEYQYEYEFKQEENDFNLIIDKIVSLYFKNNSIYAKMCNYIKSKLKLRREFEDKLASFFVKTNTESKAFYDIYNSEVSFDDKRPFLTYLVREEHINFLIDEYNNKKRSKKEIFYFRNVLSHNNYSLSLKLQEEFLKSTDCSFEDQILKEEVKNEWTKFYQNKSQREFDLLFNKSELKSKVTQYFERFEDEIFTRDNQLDDRKEYYRSLELQQSFPQTFINLIHNTFSEFQRKTITIDDVNKVIESELYLIKNIHRLIANDKNGSLEINGLHLNFIESWCQNSILKAIFWEAYNYQKANNYLRCSLIHFFVKKFDFKLEESQYLDMLTSNVKLYNEHSTVDSNPIEFITKKVELEKVKEKVLLNIRKGIVNEYVFKNHAVFSLENNIEEVNSEIKNFIAKKGGYTDQKISVLKKYSECIDDINFIKKLIVFDFNEEHSNYIAWTCVDILLNKNESQFIIEALLENLKKIQNINQELEVIRYLVRANYDRSFNLLKNWIINNIDEYNKEINYRISSSDWDNHTNPKSIPDLIEIANISSSSNYKFGDFANPIRIVHHTLRSISQKNNAETCQKIITSVSNCLSSVGGDIDTFHLNTILNDTWKDYYNHRSKSFSFPEIARKIEDFRYQIN